MRTSAALLHAEVEAHRATAVRNKQSNLFLKNWAIFFLLLDIFLFVKAATEMLHECEVRLREVKAELDASRRENKALQLKIGGLDSATMAKEDSLLKRCTKTYNVKHWLLVLLFFLRITPCTKVPS